MENEQTSPSLQQIMGALRRRAPWMLLCLVLVAGAAYGVSKHLTKKYTATASLVFDNSQPSQQAAGLPIVGGNNQPAQLNTNANLVQLGDMAARTAGLLGQGLTKDKVSEDLSISAKGESNIVNVSATSISPALAASIANTYTKLFVSEQQNSNHLYYSSALALVNKQLAALSPQQRAGAAGLALQERAQSLGVLAELQSGTVQVAQAATIPTSPSSPKVTRNTVVGAVLGLLLGLGAVFLLERLDPRIRAPEDLGAIYRLPLLGAVAESRALARSARRVGGARAALPPGEAEVFQLIRAHLRYFNVDRELRTLLVASPARGDGKTTVALHLAAAAAVMGSAVLVLEADLRHPTVAQRLDLQSAPGVSDVLIGWAYLPQALQSVHLDQPLGAFGRGPAFDVLVAGTPLPSNPGKLFESDAMDAALEQARSRYDLIVIDTPPLTAVSDAFPLLRKVDGVLIVGWVGRNRRDLAERLHQAMAGTGAPLLGVIANGFKARRGSDGHGYSTPHQQPASTPAAAASNGASESDEPVARTSREIVP
jgi:succinoglycan biosynthesis transport protein ExoP